MTSCSLCYWGRVMLICVSKLTIIGSDNGLSPGQRQAIIWANAGILLIGPFGTNFSEILIEILTFSFKKMCLKVSSGKGRPFCLGLNVLTSLLNCYCLQLNDLGTGIENQVITAITEVPAWQILLSSLYSGMTQSAPYPNNWSKIIDKAIMMSGIESSSTWSQHLMLV